MFGNRFAFDYQGAGEESWGGPPWIRGGQRRQPWGAEWTPPWAHEEWHGPHFFAARRGRGPFGPGRPFGPGGPFGSGGEGRVFGRGDMKFVVLELLQERPMHGYEMMKALEEKSGGFYTPSPGSIYPTLQMLEEGGYVTSKEIDGKKVYTITESGRALLTERQGKPEQHEGPPWMHRRGHERGERGSRAELQALRSESMEVARLFAIAGRMSIQDPQQMARLRAVIERTRAELQSLIYNEGEAQSSPTPAQTSTDQPT